MVPIPTPIAIEVVSLPTAWISIVVSGFLGLAAVVASIYSIINAKKINKKTIELTEQSNRHQKENKELEIKIALFNERFEIYKFFVDIGEVNFFNFKDRESILDSYRKCLQIQQKIHFLLQEETRNILSSKIEEIKSVLASKSFPQYKESDIKDQKLIEYLQDQPNEEIKRAIVFLYRVSDVDTLFDPYRLNL